MPKNYKLSYEELYDLYIEKALSTYEIAKIKGCSNTAIWNNLNKYGILIRNYSDCQSGSKGRNYEKTGKLHPSFKHGLTKSGHNRITINGERKLRHRIVAENLLNRKLSKSEIVHHVNGIKTDNDPKNLWIFPSQKEHAKFHWDGTIHEGTIFLKDLLTD